MPYDGVGYIRDAAGNIIRVATQAEEEARDAGFPARIVVSEEAPDEPADGQLWLERQQDGNTWQLWAWDANEGDWLFASAGLGEDGRDRQVGVFNVDFGGVHGLEVQPAGSVFLRAISSDGNNFKQITVGPTQIAVHGNKVILSNLPTTDPATDGQLWNDSGTLKVSAG